MAHLGGRKLSDSNLRRIGRSNFGCLGSSGADVTFPPKTCPSGMSVGITERWPMANFFFNFWGLHNIFSRENKPFKLFFFRVHWLSEDYLGGNGRNNLWKTAWILTLWHSWHFCFSQRAGPEIAGFNPVLEVETWLWKKPGFDEVRVKYLGKANLRAVSRILHWDYPPRTSQNALQGDEV